MYRQVQFYWDFTKKLEMMTPHQRGHLNRGMGRVDHIIFVGNKNHFEFQS